MLEFFPLREGMSMKTLKLTYFYSIGLLLGVMFLIAPTGWTQTKPKTKAPVITHSFAVEKGVYGYIWKIYIEAEDPNGEMLKIASVVDQPGYGRYPTDWLYIKPEYRKHLIGYIQWNTFSSKTGYLREWTNITLNVSIFDKAGNESNEVVFPFTFETGVKDQYNYKLPALFDQGDLPRLGYIHIGLFEPTNLGGHWRR
jgi:hypothetical protein